MIEPMLKADHTDRAENTGSNPFYPRHPPDPLSNDLN